MLKLTKKRPQNKDISFKSPKVVSLRAALLISIFFAIVFSSLSVLASWLILKSNHTANIQTSREVISSEGEVFNKIASEVGQSVVSILAPTNDGESAAGTGVLIDDKGLILTNKHVVSQSSGNVQIVDYKNVKHQATILGRDPSNDLAFLRISDLEGIPPAKLGDSSSVKVGDKVLAIGNALGEFQNTVTSGIISGIGRPIEVSDENGASYESLFNLIQTDAAINPGNSGGPLVNINGEVIGINTAIVQDAEGLGFSIPINDAKTLIAQVQQNGDLGQKAYLGVRYINLTPSISRQLGVNITEGALIYNSQASPIEQGSPAEKAGLQEYDVIISVSDTPLNSKTSLSTALAKFKPGQEVELTISRNNQQQKLKVTLGSASTN